MWIGKGLWDKIVGQKRAGNFMLLVGSLKEIANHTILWISIINFALIAATAYYTTIFPIVEAKVPWFNFALFFTCLVLVTLLAMFFEYKFIMPAVLTFRNRQMGKFEFPTKAEIQKLTRMLEELTKKYEDSHNK